MFKRKKIIRSQSGFAAIVSVVVVSVAILMIAKTAALISLREIEMADAGNKGDEALALAEGCGEEMLRQLELNNQYEVDSLKLSLVSGECEATVTHDEERSIIEVTGIKQDYFKKIRITAVIASSSVTIAGWQEFYD